MITTAVIVLGMLTVVLLTLLAARVNRLKRPHGSAVELSGTPPPEKLVLDPTLDVPTTTEVMARFPVERTRFPVEQMRFPAEPTRFVGRAEVMAAASTALAPASGRRAVVFQGMAGAGKTTCAVELAYRHQRAFVASAFWSAPTDPDQFDDALRLLAVALEAQLADYGFAMVEEIATLERLKNFLPTLAARPTKTVGDQLFDRPMILRRRQVRIIWARTAPGGLWRPDARPPSYTASPCTGGSTAAGSRGNKLISHGFGRSLALVHLVLGDRVLAEQTIHLV